MIKAINIYKSYGDLAVLNGVSLSIDKAEIVTILGKSGAGKSTLLHIMGTLDNADKGALTINGVDVMKLNENELARFRNDNIGFVFQFHHLIPEFTALENVCIPALIKGLSKTEAEKKARVILDYLGLSERLTHKPSEMSGGEQQRVAFARALINDPMVIFADEPTGNLDGQTSEELHQLIIKLREDYNQTFVIVTHNEDLAQMSDRSVNMDSGTLVKS
jgi:lipoprotein-releasing system ATP-binding protein